MPMTPSHRCHGCGAMVSGRCTTCARSQRQRYDLRRGSRQSRGYDAAWEHWRRSTVDAYGLVFCGDRPPAAPQTTDSLCAGQTILGRSPSRPRPGPWPARAGSTIGPAARRLHRASVTCAAATRVRRAPSCAEARKGTVTRPSVCREPRHFATKGCAPERFRVYCARANERPLAGISYPSKGFRPQASRGRCVRQDCRRISSPRLSYCKPTF